MQYAVILQYTYEMTINKRHQWHQHEYKIKFKGDKRHELLKEFTEKYGYKWNDEDIKNEADVPDGFHCWCQCMSEWLIEKGFKCSHSTEQRETWECAII